MPDQSSAATEHSILQEITAPLASLPDDPVPIAADPDFPIVLRGYDRVAVDAYVNRTSQLVAELQATRSPEAAIRRALERVGEEVAGVLQRAHDTAEQITAQSRSEAEDRLEAARREGAEVTSLAAERVRELDAETERIWAERHQIVQDTRALAEQLLALADSAARRFPAEEAPEEIEVTRAITPELPEAAEPVQAPAPEASGLFTPAPEWETPHVFDHQEAPGEPGPAAAGDVPLGSGDRPVASEEGPLAPAPSPQDHVQ